MRDDFIAFGFDKIDERNNGLSCKVKTRLLSLHFKHNFLKVQSEFLFNPSESLLCRITDACESAGIGLYQLYAD